MLHNAEFLKNQPLVCWTFHDQKRWLWAVVQIEVFENCFVHVVNSILLAEILTSVAVKAAPHSGWQRAWPSERSWLPHKHHPLLPSCATSSHWERPTDSWNTNWVGCCGFHGGIISEWGLKDTTCFHLLVEHCVLWWQTPRGGDQSKAGLRGLFQPE